MGKNRKQNLINFSFRFERKLIGGKTNSNDDAQLLHSNRTNERTTIGDTFERDKHILINFQIERSSFMAATYRIHLQVDLSIH